MKVGNVTEVTPNNYSLFWVEYDFGILLRDNGRTVKNIEKNIIIGAIYYSPYFYCNLDKVYFLSLLSFLLKNKCD
uniref:Uncharacterized protein n=1 Tax=Histophilus somni (strain 129Pt) TaxID=205914 RepID=Q0I2Q9_HISS1